MKNMIDSIHSTFSIYLSEKCCNKIYAWNQKWVTFILFSMPNYSEELFLSAVFLTIDNSSECHLCNTKIAKKARKKPGIYLYTNCYVLLSQLSNLPIFEYYYFRIFVLFNRKFPTERRTFLFRNSGAEKLEDLTLY